MPVGGVKPDYRYLIGVVAPQMVFRRREERKTQLRALTQFQLCNLKGNPKNLTDRGREPYTATEREDDL